jgi:hypothetical protein
MEQGRMAGLSAAQALGHIEPQAAETGKDEVRQRLEALRVGSFGDARAIAREKILSLSAAGDA